MTNPLLTPFELPPFSKIQPEHVVPAVTKALNDCRENVERVVAQGAPYTGKIFASGWRKWTMSRAYLLSGQPSELGEKQPGTARSLRTNAAAAV